MLSPTDKSVADYEVERFAKNEAWHAETPSDLEPMYAWANERGIGKEEWRRRSEVVESVAAKCNEYDALKRKADLCDELTRELLAAEKIILAMLNVMTVEQKTQAAEKLHDVSADGMTRFHERRAILSKAGA